MNIHMLIDILDIFQKHQINKNSLVIIKVDIEGAEFQVLRHLLNRGLLAHIDTLAVEWHYGGYFKEGGEEKTKEKQCIDWMLQDLSSQIKIEDWSRRRKLKQYS